jgi:hypothetical protein
MDSWEMRPIEVANLLNPAFCGEILFYAMSGYHAESQKNFPYVYSFLVLPIILHSNTREKIPPKKNMNSWIQENPEIKIGFSDRVKNLIPITKEALIFLIQTGCLNFDNFGDLYIIKSVKARNKQNKSAEIENCIRNSTILGRKLAKSGSISVTYAMWGIKP